jgi:soluble lytic murein transglycosylase
MARAPTYDNLQQSQNTIPNATAQNAASAEMFTTGAKQIEAYGAAQQRVGAQGVDMAVDMQREANRLRVDDALNKAREEALRLTYDREVGYRNLRGIDALERPDGKPLTEEYAEKLQQTMGTLSQGLGNDAQRRAFTSEGNNLLSSFRQNTMQHEGEEFRTYSMSVRDGTIANRMNEIGHNWNNPQVVNEAIESIRAATYDKLRLLGRTGEFDSEVRKAVSAASLTAIKAAIQNDNPRYADQYIKRYADQMEADHLLDAQGVLTERLDTQLAVEVVQDVFRDAAPSMDPSGFDRLMRITHMSESSGRVANRDGTPIINTNRNGTRDLGPFQINENSGPEIARLAGVEWDEERAKTDEAYGRLLAETYMKKNLQDFGGNIAQAISAYNAGPGATREAIARAEREGGNWMDYIPPATRQRVEANVRDYSAGAGRGQRPTLLDIQNQVRERVGTDNPERLQKATELAERQFNLVNKAIEQRDEEAVSSAMQALIQNGGGYASLPVELRTAIPPDKVGSVIDFARKMAAGEDVQTDWQTYYDLKSNPQTLAQANLMAMRGHLNDSEFRELVKEQQNLRTGGRTQMSSLRSEEQLIKQYLSDAGFEDDSEGYDQRVGRVWSAYSAQVRAQEATVGRKLNPVEKEQTLARLMTSVEIDTWGSNTQYPAAAVDPASDAVVVPRGDRAVITAALRRAGKPATEQNIRALFLRARTGQQ